MGSRAKSGRDGGFTLIELLVVIVILGVLATVVVFAVGGVVDRGEVSALEGDARTLQGAEEAHYAIHGEYATEADLVSAGLLRDESRLHDITVDADGEDYTIAAVPSGGSGGSGSATTTTVAAPPSGETTTTTAAPPSGETTTTTAAPPVEETTTTTAAPGPGPGEPGGPPLQASPASYAGQPGWSYGPTSSPKTLVIIGNGSGSAGQALWQQISTAGTALRVDTQVIWMDSVSTKSEVDSIRASSPTYIIVPVQVPMSGAPGHSYVGQYLNSIMSSPSQFWWGQGQTQAGHPITESIGYYLAHF